MKVVSVNVGLPREVVWKGITVQTAISGDSRTATARKSVRPEVAKLCLSVVEELVEIIGNRPIGGMP